MSPLTLEHKARVDIDTALVAAGRLVQKRKDTHLDLSIDDFACAPFGGLGNARQISGKIRGSMLKELLEVLAA